MVQWEQIGQEALIALLTHSDNTPIGVSLECDGSVCSQCIKNPLMKKEIQEWKIIR